jgi:FlgD Ig-like domain
MRKSLLITFLALTLIGLNAGVWADIFASDISATGGVPAVSINYRLNEAATTVSVEIVDPDDSTTFRTLTGTTALGTNSVIWDGTDGAATDYTKATFIVRITADDTTGHAAYDQIAASSDTIGTLIGDAGEANRPDV